MPTEKTSRTSFKKFISVCLTLAALQAGSVLAGDLHLPLTGSIAIDSQGHVTDCEIISKPGSEAVKAAVLQSMRGWRFVPVVRDGIAVPARSKVNLRLLATEVNGGYEMKIERAQFFGGREPADKGMEPPRYPKDAARIGLSGNVLLALQVDSQGSVTDVVSVQSSLLVSHTPESVMRRWRKVFEKASEDAARKWTFKPADPAKGDELVTTLIVPVTYRIGDGSGSALQADDEGWQQDKAGPMRQIPWLAVDQQQFDANGLRDGQVMALAEPPITPAQPLVGRAL